MTEVFLSPTSVSLNNLRNAPYACPTKKWGIDVVTKLWGLHLAGARSASLALCVLLLTLGAQTTRAADTSKPAGDPTRAHTETGQRFAVVRRVSGDVTAVSNNGATVRPLHHGDIVHVGEHILSASNGEAVLLTDDAGMIGVRPGAEFVAESFAAQAQARDHMVLRLIRGGLRVITGWISRVNPDEYTIDTPVALIGIRGTDHEPYVLLDETLTAPANKPGLYDKVDRGSTVLKNVKGELQVNSGQVGFVGAKPRIRGLMTLLLPVLLDRVPDFYVGGQFENELDEYSRSADQVVLQKLEQARAASNQATTTACASAEKVVKDWISSFDAAVERRDARSVLELFAEDVSIKAKVRDANGALVETALTRQELADSAISAVQGLENYSQQRGALQASTLPAEPGEACDRVQVKSFVVEQGKLAGKLYRIESQEAYVLARRDRRWLAINASTTQR